MISNTTHRRAWMTDEQFECFEFLADLFGGFHHVYTEPKPFGNGICLNDYSHRMSTFDFETLTTAVFLAHDRMIRFEVQPSGPQMLKLCLHKRHSREGHVYDRHPTVTAALARHRERFPAPAHD